MKFYSGTVTRIVLIRLSCVIIFIYSISGFTFGQETNSQVSGIVKSDKQEILAGATITLIHEPTKNVFTTTSDKNGWFYIFNLKPGGPYSITISFTGHTALKKENLFLRFTSLGHFFDLRNDEVNEFILQIQEEQLKEVVVRNSDFSNKYGTATSINQLQLSALPSISRNFQDYVRLVPQSKVNGDGMMSFAGQNNKYNAFYIDGSNSNDILGVALSGTSGGQTSSPPISIEAIEEMNVLLAPYDVQFSNFTGAIMNAITKSGTNEFKTSAWYFFRNEQMTGRSPVPVDSVGSRTRLAPFFNQTGGMSISGALVKNKLFYFTLFETQDELQRQPFILSQYRGNSSQQQLEELAAYIKNTYQYDPGSFLESKNSLKATRFMTKLDWNHSERNKITLSYRFNNAERLVPQTQNGSTLIRFANNGIIRPARTHSASFEWRSFPNKTINNRFLLSYTNELDDYRIIGQPFPTITIRDGIGTIVIGSNPNAQINCFKASDFNLIDALKLKKDKHVFTGGIDLNVSNLNDILLPGYFGSYRFRNVNDFLNDDFPTRLQRTVSLVDEPTTDDTKAAAVFSARRLGLFVNDDIQVTPYLRLNIGFRLDGNSLHSSYQADNFFNEIAIPAIETYYDLQDARSGQNMKTHWQPSPRFGIAYKMPSAKLTLRGGSGIFSGRILNLWGSDVFRTNQSSIDVIPQLHGVKFNPDPFAQPTYQSLGLDPESAKGDLVVMTKKFRYPTIFRSSVGIDKRLRNSWVITSELIFTKYIHEVKYVNVNLLPPTQKTPLPDSRNVYSAGPVAPRIPMNGGNPYDRILLMTNNKEKNGYSYSFTLSVSKVLPHKFYFNAAYTFGNSFSLFEPTANAGPNVIQWSQSETVNGKNFTQRSISDFDYAHRVLTSLTYKVDYCNNKTTTLFSVFYNGQSGTPYSYVYANSMVNDNGRDESFDLVFVPGKTELRDMIFLPNRLPGGIILTPEQQRNYLDEFIENDKYLRKRRGMFAERNGARLPFTNIIDLRIQQDFRIRLNKKISSISVIYDVFNFTNMLKKDWGHTYSLPFDKYPLITFEGFANQSSLTPQYTFTPLTGEPWTIQTSTAPGNSARWISQLGFKITFN